MEAPEILSPLAVAAARWRPRSRDIRRWRYLLVHLPLQATFETRARVIELTILSLGLLSLIALIAQLRQTAAWNRVLSYHEYFKELPSADKVRALASTLQRLGIRQPNFGQPLSDDDVRKVRADTGIQQPDGGFREIGDSVVRAYLNDFEEFCGAVNAGVVSNCYARELEGTRTINAYYGFEPMIRIYRQQQGEIAAQHATVSKGRIRGKAYCELRKVAREWKARREWEHSRHVKRHASWAQFLADADDSDGVGPQT